MGAKDLTLAPISRRRVSKDGLEEVEERFVFHVR